MKRNLATRWGPILGLLLAVGHAQADLIQPVSWSYDWTVAPTVLAGDRDNTGGISFAITPDIEKARGNSSIIVANLTTFSSAPSDNPDTFSGQVYTMTLNLTDDASAASGSLTFTAKLTGTLSAFNANINNTFQSPTTQELTLGDYTYTVTMGPYAAPGPPGSDNSGSVSAFVEIKPRDGSVVQTPEPTSLALASLGLTVLAWRRWRRRGAMERVDAGN